MNELKLMPYPWQPVIRTVIYCIQFEDDPTQAPAVDHALRIVVDRSHLGRDAYRDAIVSALASNELVSKVIPQDHSEETIRRFLELLLARL